MQNDKDLSGKVIVITGASSGFGKGSALAFARCGARLVLAARREQLLDELARECQSAGGAAIVVPTDVSDQADMAALASSATREFGRVDVWINNAGAGAIGKFEEIPLEDHVQVIQTDLLGTLYGCYFAMQVFREQGHGTIINVSSVLGKVPMPYYSSYVAAKHGVSALGAAIRLEREVSKNESIHVCTVQPTSTDTPFFEHAANYSGHEFLPTPPVYDPQDVIDVIVRLAAEPEDEVSVGAAAKMAVLGHSVAPGTVESRMAKSTHETLEKAPPASETDGNLMETSPKGRGVRSTGKRAKKSA